MSINFTVQLDFEYLLFPPLLTPPLAFHYVDFLSIFLSSVITAFDQEFWQPLKWPLTFQIAGTSFTVHTLNKTVSLLASIATAIVVASTCLFGNTTKDAFGLI